MKYIHNEQLRLLVTLQEYDNKITEIKSRQKNLPDLIEAASIPLKRAMEEHAKTADELERVNKERRELEQALQDIENTIRKLKSKSLEIKTNKEYQAILKEIALAENEKSEIEEKILLLFDRIDDLKSQMLEKERYKKEKEAEFNKEKKKVEDELDQLAENLKECERQKALLIPKVETGLFEKYTKLMASRRNLAVVPVENEYCLGCHMRIPPQMFAELKKNDKITYCLNCHRILYWRPPE